MAKRKKSAAPEIEKGIPIPPKRKGGVPGLWASMEVGDSVLLEGASQNQATGRFAPTAKRKGWKFITRKVDGGVRVWRVK